jgi:hypothetical protein
VKSDTLADGRKVIERTTAKLKIPSYDEPMPCTTIDEVLLDDGAVVFQCVHPDPIPGTDGPCMYVSANGTGVRAHQKVHGKMAQARWATAEATRNAERAAQAEAELAESRRRKSESGKKAAETRKAKRVNGSETPSLANGELDFAALDRTISQLTVTTQVIIDDLTGTVESLADVLESIKEVREHVKKLPVAGADLVEKAKAYDVIAGALNRR